MRYISLLFAFFLGINVNAQWTTITNENTLVVNDVSGDMKAIGTSDGQTYIVYWKVVAAPTNYELRLQVLDVDGYQQLGENGALISNTISMSTYTSVYSVTIDGNDNLYIGVTATGDGSAHAFKVDIDGNNLWGTNGVSLDDLGYVVTILPLDNGDVIASWFPDGQAKMQKYDADGNAVWDSPQSVMSGTNNTSPGNLFQLSDGYFLMIFHELGFSIYSTLYAQKYDSLGVAQWTNPTQLSNQTTAYINLYSGTQDGDAVYLGYYASSNNRFDSFVQRINTDGTLPWGINGKDFDTNETDFEMDTKIAFYPESDYVWSICTYTNPNQSEKGESVQKFDKTSGDRQFTETAHEVYAISSNDNQHASVLTLLNDQPVFILKSGTDNGATPVTLSMLKLDENGDFVWDAETSMLADYSANKSRIHLTNPVDGQSVAVFIEDKGNGTQIYAQNHTDVSLTVDQISGDRMMISYKNPIEGELRIHSETLINEVIVYNLVGKLIYTNSSVNSSDISINSQDWESGLYLMTLISNESIQKGIKIVKH